MKDAKKSFRQYRMILVYISAIAVSVLLLFFIIYPASVEVYEKYGSNRELAESVQKLESKKALLDNLNEELLREQLNQLLAAIPSDKSVGTLITTLESVGSQTSVNLANITVAAPGSISTDSAKIIAEAAEAKGIPAIAYKSSIIGDTQQLRQFVATIQNVRRVIGMVKMEINFDENSIGIGEIQLLGFYSPLPTTLGDITTPLEPLTKEELDTVTKVLAIPNISTEITPPVAGSYPVKDNPFSMQ